MQRLFEKIGQSTAFVRMLRRQPWLTGDAVILFLNTVKLPKPNHQARMSVPLSSQLQIYLHMHSVNTEATQVLDYCTTFHFVIKIDHRCQQHVFHARRLSLHRGTVVIDSVFYLQVYQNQLSKTVVSYEVIFFNAFIASNPYQHDWSFKFLDSNHLKRPLNSTALFSYIFWFPSTVYLYQEFVQL